MHKLFGIEKKEPYITHRINNFAKELKSKKNLRKDIKSKIEPIFKKIKEFIEKYK